MSCYPNSEWQGSNHAGYIFYYQSLALRLCISWALNRLFVAPGLGPEVRDQLHTSSTGNVRGVKAAPASWWWKFKTPRQLQNHSSRRCWGMFEESKKGGVGEATTYCFVICVNVGEEDQTLIKDWGTSMSTARDCTSTLRMLEIQ